MRIPPRLVPIFTPLLVAIAVVAALGVVGNMDVADEYLREAAEKEARPARVLELRDGRVSSWWTAIEPSGHPVTLADCADVTVTINHAPCYSNEPCALRRICYWRDSPGARP